MVHATNPDPNPKRTANKRIPGIRIATQQDIPVFNEKANALRDKQYGPHRDFGAMAYFTITEIQANNIPTTASQTIYLRKDN